MVLIAVLIVFLSIGMGGMILQKNLVQNYVRPYWQQTVISFVGMVCRGATIYLFISGIYVIFSGDIPKHYQENGSIPYGIMTVLMGISIIGYIFAHRISMLQYCAKKIFA